MIQESRQMNSLAGLVVADSALVSTLLVLTRTTNTALRTDVELLLLRLIWVQSRVWVIDNRHPTVTYSGTQDGAPAREYLRTQPLGRLLSTLAPTTTYTGRPSSISPRRACAESYLSFEAQASHPKVRTEGNDIDSVRPP